MLSPDSFSKQQQKQSVSDIPIDEEEWYHGALPRLETEELLVNDGDFLVREKSDASGQYVLSAKTNSRIRHFPIQLNEDVSVWKISNLHTISLGSTL